MRHTEIALDFFFSIASLLVGNDRNVVLFDLGDARDYCMIIGEPSVSVQFDEDVGDQFYYVERIWPSGMSGESGSNILSS
jgi:hypothetical protein